MDVLSQVWEKGLLFPVLVAVAALFLYFIANSVFRRIVKAVQSRVRESGIPFELLSTPFRLLAVLLLVSLTLPYLPLSEFVAPVFRHAFTVVSIVVAVWFLMRLLAVLEQFVLLHYASGLQNSEAAARKVATHVSLARKILNVHDSKCMAEHRCHKLRERKIGKRQRNQKKHGQQDDRFGDIYFDYRRNGCGGGCCG